MPEKNVVIEKLRSKAEVPVTGIHWGPTHWSGIGQQLPWKEGNPQGLAGEETPVAEAHPSKRRAAGAGWEAQAHSNPARKVDGERKWYKGSKDAVALRYGEVAKRNYVSQNSRPAKFPVREDQKINFVRDFEWENGAAAIFILVLRRWRQAFLVAHTCCCLLLARLIDTKQWAGL